MSNVWTAFLSDAFKVRKNPHDEIRYMNVYELKSFVRKNRSVAEKLRSRKYSENDRVLASQLVYAKNLLRIKA